MRLLIIGAGGVGSSSALILSRRNFYESVCIADYDLKRASDLVDKMQDKRFTAAHIDASNPKAVAALARQQRATYILNAVDQRFVPSIFEGAFLADCNYLDTAMSLSIAHPDRPHELPGLKLGDQQFEQHEKWRKAGLLALVGVGVEPGLSDIFARFAVDHLFSDITELGVRDGANLVVEGHDFAPTFSMWTVIEECLNPPVIWEKGRGWYTTEPFSGKEVFEFPEGIGAVECVNVEHEEVLLMPREFPHVGRVTFKFGLGDEFIGMLQMLHKLGLDNSNKINVGGVKVAPRDVVAACLPDPLTIGHKMKGKTCAGLLVTGKGKDGKPREVYIYHIADNEWTMREYGAQAVVWQTAMNPVTALELLATGKWAASGVIGPEALPSEPFLELLSVAHGQPWKIQERDPVTHKVVHTTLGLSVVSSSKKAKL